MLERLVRPRPTQLHNGGRTLLEMKVGNQKLVLALIFAFCVMAGPHCVASGIHGEIRKSLAVRNQTTDNTRARDANPESFERLAERAQAAMDAERVPEAIRLYDHAIRLRPDWPEGWWHLGTLLFDAGRFREARDAFAHFASIERKQPGPGFAMLGLSEFQLKHYSRALQALERGRKLGLGTNPDFVRSVLFHDGITNARLGKPEIALLRLTLAANQIASAHPEAPEDAVLADLKLLDAFGIAALRIPKLPSDLAALQI